MTTTAELIQTFESLAISQRANADRIVAVAAAQGMPLGDLTITINYLREKADECEVTAQALRDEDAVSIDDIASGGIEGPFVDSEGHEL